MTNLPDFRIACGPLKASRSLRVFAKVKGTSPAAKRGLRYENRVAKELEYHVHLGHFTRIEHNPWFSFTDTFGSSTCSPDFLAYFNDNVIIIEVKLTWKEVAIHKLNDLYSPVVTAALGVSTSPLVICRNATLDSPPMALTLREAIRSPYRLLQWPDNGRILW